MAKVQSSAPACFVLFPCKPQAGSELLLTSTKLERIDIDRLGFKILGSGAGFNKWMLDAANPSIKSQTKFKRKIASSGLIN